MKKEYIAPVAAEVRLAVHRMVMASPGVEVAPGEEGDQSGAESRRFWSATMWDDSSLTSNL